MSLVFSFFKHLANFFKQNFLALVSGILVGTSYIPLAPWALLFCLSPLWWSTIKDCEKISSAPKASKRIFLIGFQKGWLAQFFLSIIGFHWISYVSHEFGYMSWPVSIFLLLLFASTVHIYFALATGFGAWLQCQLKLKSEATVLVIACFTGILETYWPSLFPWNFGYPFLWIRSPIAQVSDVIGFQGLSYLVLLINAFVTITAIRITKKKQWRTTMSFSTLLILILCATLGGLHFWGLSKKSEWEQADQKLSILQIQANIGNLDKIMAEKGQGFQQSILDRYFQLTREGLNKFPDTELVVWPETAFPEYLNKDRFLNSYTSQFIQFVKGMNKAILTGAYSTKNFQTYNAVFLYGPDGLPIGEPYHKTNLLVFGEYTPLTDYFPKLAQISPAGLGFSRGHGPHVFNYNGIKLGAQVCYESLYPDFSAKLADLGADILFNLTNDSWFGPTFEPLQHMIMTEARAIETRRPLFRNTNTGITTAVLADGTELARSPWFTSWYDVFNIKYKKNAEITFYTRYHQYIVLVLILILALSLTMRSKK